MITCPNCGSENRYGAIFCRGCGKKLDIIDEITVENIDEKTRGKKRRRRRDKAEPTPKELRKRGMIVNAIRIAVILLVAFAVYLTQQTPSLSAISTSEASKSSFDRKKGRLDTAIKNKKEHSEKITEKEINSYIAALVPKAKSGKFVRLENVQVALDSDEKRVDVRMYLRVFGKRMLFRLFGTLEKENGHIKFSPATFGKVGNLPYPAFLIKLHSRNIFSEMKDEMDIFNKLTTATITEFSVVGGNKRPGVDVKVSGK
jgi:hypothetical protein